MAGNAKTGNAVAWNNGSMYADKNGNVYNYNQSSGAQKYNASSGSWQPVSKPTATGGANESAWASRESSAQALGAQRADDWQRAGGGGWGAARGSYGGFRGGGRR